MDSFLYCFSFLLALFLFVVMKILQTGDLHLGKLFYERSLIPDQKHMLSQIVQEIKNEAASGSPYKALLVCGDVYDRSVPPAEAVELFSNFLAELKNASPELHIFIISGNHDSANRLSYAAELLDFQRIHIRTSFENIETPVVVDGTAFYLFPFCQPSAGRTGENEADAPNAQEAFIAKIASAARKNSGAEQSVLLAHLFTAGSVTSESERGVWGTAEQVDSKVFSEFSYTALGHLHRFQKAGKNVYYAGSPLAYSFDENSAEKCLLCVELEPDTGPVVTKISVTPLHKVVRLSGTFADFYEGDRFLEFKDDFVEINCQDDTIVENPVLLLKSHFSNLLSFRQEKAIIEETSSDMAARRDFIFQAKGNIQEHFALFLSDLQQDGADEEELKLFKKLLDEKEKDETA